MWWKNGSLLALVCLIVACRFPGREETLPDPIDAGWCDRFDRMPIPKRDTPYLIEGAWIDNGTNDTEITFYPNGSTDDPRVRWRIENGRYHHLIGNEPIEFFVYAREQDRCTVKTIYVDREHMIIRHLDSEAVFTRSGRSASMVERPDATDAGRPDGGES